MANFFRKPTEAEEKLINASLAAMLLVSLFQDHDPLGMVLGVLLGILLVVSFIAGRARHKKARLLSL